MKKSGLAPRTIVTDKLRSYAAAFGDLGLTARRHQVRWKNNRIEGSHVYVRHRERRMQGFRSPGAAQRFLSTCGDLQRFQHPPSFHSQLLNTENVKTKPSRSGVKLPGSRRRYRGGSSEA